MQKLTILHGLPGEGKSYALRRLEDEGHQFFDPEDVHWYNQTAADEDVDSFFACLDQKDLEPPWLWRPPSENLQRSYSYRYINNLACFLRNVEEDDVVLIDDFMSTFHPTLQSHGIDWMLSLLPDDVEIVISTNSAYVIGERDALMVRAKDFIQERNL